MGTKSQTSQNPPNPHQLHGLGMKQKVLKKTFQARLNMVSVFFSLLLVLLSFRITFCGVAADVVAYVTKHISCFFFAISFMTTDLALEI